MIYTLSTYQRLFLATSGCTVNVQGGRITFKWGCYTTFCFMDEKIISPNSFLSDVLPISPEIETKDDWSYLGPSDSNWISTKDPDQGYVKVEFAAPTPPSIPGVETYASNESSMSDYCRFTQLVLSYLIWKKSI